MHRSLKPHASTAQAKKVQPPTIPGDSPQDLHHYQQPQQHHQQHHHHPHHQPLIPLYRLSGPLRHHQNQADDGISMSGSSIVSSPSLEEGGFNLPRETSVALRLKDEVAGPAVAPSASNVLVDTLNLSSL